MPPGRPSEGKLQRAKDYILAHPDESKDQQAAGANVSRAYIGTARKELIEAGLLAPSRKAYPSPVLATIASEEAAQGTESPPRAVPAVNSGGSLRDHEAMVALAELADQIDTMTPDEVLKKLARQCLIFSFDPKLHVDTRMSAGQQWLKLRDAQKAKDLGMGKPLTREDAVGRLNEMQYAAGPEITFEAIMAAPQDFRVALLTKLVEAFDAQADEAPAAGGTPPDAPPA